MVEPTAWLERTPLFRAVGAASSTMQCIAKLGSDFMFMLLSAVTLSLGVVMLIMLPSFAVCSGDITTKSYM